ncbi:hypothetical protein BUALT_Bualt15G0106700 [Buddleja alternifolia]|uniref:DUF4283 domain-containing protein n=1 Tax=Buddleja alternifolia TaxID=168488 RepID=A0AAV6WMG1_9LAMI|nr:hypothetical protein BUALT_Bualt15G0106700 [Buddleja alternifolia]
MPIMLIPSISKVNASSSDVDVERELARLRDKLLLRDDESEGVFVPAGLWESDTSNRELKLVGRVLTKRSFNFDAFKGTLLNLFRPKRGLDIHKIDQERFVLVFEHPVDMKKTIEGCPWCIISRFPNAPTKLLASLVISWDVLSMWTFHKMVFPGVRVSHIEDPCHLQYADGFVDPGDNTPYGPWLRATIGFSGRTVPQFKGPMNSSGQSRRTQQGHENSGNRSNFWSNRGAGSADSWRRAPLNTATDNTSTSRHSPRGNDGTVVGVTPGVENVEMGSVREDTRRSGGLAIHREVLGDSGDNGPTKDGGTELALSGYEEISESDLVSVPLTMARGRGMRWGQGRGGVGGEGVFIRWFNKGRVKVE